MSTLANKIWERHIEVFSHFDLVCNNGSSLEDEIKSFSIVSAIVTLEEMDKRMPYTDTEILSAIEYLRCSKHYSDDNSNSTY